MTERERLSSTSSMAGVGINGLFSAGVRNREKSAARSPEAADRKELGSYLADDQGFTTAKSTAG